MKKNFLFTAISIGSRLLTGLLLFVLLARLWGPTDFGLFSFVFSLVAIIVLVVDFGFAGYLLREIGATPEHLPHIFRDGMAAKRWLVVPCLLITVAVEWFLGDMAPEALLLPLLLAGLLLSFADFYIAPLRALGRYDIETVVVVSANFAQFALATLVAWHGGGPVEVAWVIVLSRLAYLGLAWFSLRRTAPKIRGAKRSGESLRATFRRILPYGIDGLLTTAWSQLDVVLVRVLYGVHAAGIYAAGQKVVQGAAALAPVVGNVMIPQLARKVASTDPQLCVTAHRTSMLMWGVGLVFALPLVAAPQMIAALLFGPAYADLGELFRLFGVVLMLRYIAAGYGVLATAAGLQARRVVGQMIGIAVFLALVAIGTFFGGTLAGFLLAYAGGFMVMALLYRHYWRDFRPC